MITRKMYTIERPEVSELFHPKTAKAQTRKRDDEFFIENCSRQVPAVNTTDGIGAVIKNRSIDAKRVERYLESKFGESLETVRAEMHDLAEAFRPAIPEGVTGWGAKVTLDTDRIRSVAAAK